MTHFLRLANNRINLKSCFSVLQRLQVKASSSQASGSDDFFTKNEKMGRPMSPHLTIYKFQITSVMSLSHRATGLMMAGGLYGFSAAVMLLPGSFPYYVDILQNMHISPALVFATKFALAWTFFFHTANGIRHLAWDLGYGFELNQLNLSGYIVLGSALGLSTLAALM